MQQLKRWVAHMVCRIEHFLAAFFILLVKVELEFLLIYVLVVHDQGRVEGLDFAIGNHG